MMLDAIDNHEQPLSIERLYQWHRWLFPVNEWSVKRLNVGQLRGDAPMLVVSGRVDRPTVHFEAPPRAEFWTINWPISSAGLTRLGMTPRWIHCFVRRSAISGF
ncbi:hypothetical protein [Aeromonas veronii]|uniref:hypothetical protein n=1 Tax=Aeromonas veronii TaxID=654 RepID=UPI003F799F4E